MVDTDRHARVGLREPGYWVGALPRKIALEQAKRHVVAFERIVASQEAVVGKLEELGDDKGAEMARTFLKTCRHSLRLAVDHLNRLIQLN